MRPRVRGPSHVQCGALNEPLPSVPTVGPLVAPKDDFDAGNLVVRSGPRESENIDQKAGKRGAKGQVEEEEEEPQAFDGWSAAECWGRTRTGSGWISAK